MAEIFLSFVKKKKKKGLHQLNGHGHAHIHTHTPSSSSNEKDLLTCREVGLTDREPNILSLGYLWVLVLMATIMEPWSTTVEFVA